ncbi:MAG TPA: ABC transporter permease [Spirochaetota bacterium]|nr:ABC transporter permease [Spirochaetota bacterium]HNT11568.1 ABC transporter permease [Spirochaetota bacterium]HNV48964.1 ABC transporter permease [Spirochaetota bacterium]HOS41917.1 ABC transporter permease [Spirochaetota bacterium]HPI22124.1 ABC transporter permease [Spirochaetota bacterium]
MSIYELFVGLRYLKAKKSQGFISFNTVLSIVTVFIGVFMLIVVISVMNGFQSQIKDKILDVDSHITVISGFGDENENITDYRKLVERLRSVNGVRAVTPYIQGQGLFRYKTRITPILLRAMGDTTSMPDEVKKFVTKGAREFKSASDVFVGAEMAANYGIKVGDAIEVIVPKGTIKITTGLMPGIGTFRVAGFFKSGYYEFDTKLVVMSLPAAQQLYEIGDVVWGIGLKIDDIYRMDYMASMVQTRLGSFRYHTLTAEERNQNLFYALKLEKLIMTVILFLVIIAAGFTIMGTLVMVVMEKRKAIGVLKSMGARPISIMIIFVLEGFLIGVLGATLGSVFGIAASLNLEAIIKWVESAINGVMAFVYGVFNLGAYFPMSLVPKNVYYIDTIPTEIKPEFIVFIAIFAVFLSTIAAIFPSWHASRLKPVETIRYE